MAISDVFLSLATYDDFRGPAASGLFLFLSVAVVSALSFVSIAVWTEARRKEREAYYKAESLRRIAEMPGESARQIIALMQEEARAKQAREVASEFKKLEGMKIGGLITLAVGVALFFVCSMGGNNWKVGLVGLIPGLIGVALLMYALILAPKPNRD